ncbi:MAG: glycosyltransferase family 4 protein [Actinomycetota bacterium]
MKIGFLPPRYGAEIVGGAEFACRMLAIHLVEAGHVVEIFTTAARESTTWADDLPVGTTVEDGVTVHRFSAQGRAADFDEWGTPVLADPTRQPPDVVDEWLVKQGPYCPAAVDAAVASDCDSLAGYPYLYWPTVEIVRRAPDRAIVHLAAHDEPPLFLPVFGEVFAAARGLVFHTEAEERLVERVHPIAHLPRRVLGLGVTEHASAPDARERVGVGDRPFVLCLGRVDPGKGTEALARFFAAYQQRRPGPLQLVFAGPVVAEPSAHPDLHVAGIVDEDVKWGLLDEAAVLVSPSGYESFSFVVLEAMARRTPIMVNRRCGPTMEHAMGSGAGLPYDDYGTFEVSLDRLLADPDLRAALGEVGQRYVRRKFSWSAVVDRYVSFLQQVLR